MFKVANIASQSLLTANRFYFSLPGGKKRVPTKSDLSKYDVVVVGAGLGAVLSSQLDAVLKEKVKIMVAYDNPVSQFTAQRTLYEKGKLAKPDMSTSTKNLISKNNAHTEGVGVQKFNPQKNTITLRNGRTIQYQNLVIAMGQKQNFESVKGFDDAWADLQHPFYTNAEHASWKITCNKVARYLYNFNGGEAIFYIPPAPFGGQIENYNFFVAKDLWDWHAANGKISWDTSKLTIINANDTFSRHFGKVDSYIRNECEKRNISIEQNWTLVQVQKDKRSAIFKNSKTGETQQRFYGNFYSLMPYTYHSVLSQSGLADSTGLLNVNPRTLQHVKYDNIFGLGDVTNVPTTKTFWGGVEQVNVLRNNIERKLNGLSLNAEYNGFSEAPLYLSQHELSWVSHLYDGVEQSFDTSSTTAGLKYKIHTALGKNLVAQVLKFKSWGPPYYKFKKTFEGGSSAKASSGSLHPQQKVA